MSNMYTVCTELNKDGNIYGLNVNDSVIDPHMIKNVEWGAISYLSKNELYGKGEEIWNNSNNRYLTGNAGKSVNAYNESSTSEYDTPNGLEASSTGNITGVYDMSGGAYEYVAAYVDNSYVLNYGEKLVDEVKGGATRYADVYKKASNDTAINNYALIIPTNGSYGDAVYETSGSGTGVAAWYNDITTFPYNGSPFFMRGGGYNIGTDAGAFYFYYSNGSNVTGGSFRIILSIN